LVFLFLPFQVGKDFASFRFFSTRQKRETAGSMIASYFLGVIGKVSRSEPPLDQPTGILTTIAKMGKHFFSQHAKC